MYRQKNILPNRRSPVFDAINHTLTNKEEVKVSCPPQAAKLLLAFAIATSELFPDER